jgi:homocitrate synthase NifV
LLGVVLDDDALTARLLTRIRDHAMRVKQEASPDELRSFLLASLEVGTPFTAGLPT